MVAQKDAQGTDRTNTVLDNLPPEAFHTLEVLQERGSPTIWSDLAAKMDAIDNDGGGCLLAFNGEQIVVPESKVGIDNRTGAGVSSSY